MAVSARTNARRVVAATFTNAALADFALNWAIHLGRTSLRGSLLVGATDADAERALLGVHAIGAHGAACFSLRSAIGADEARWGSAGFAQMGRTKAALLAALLRLHAADAVLFADADVTFLRDPMPYLVAHLALPTAAARRGEPTASGRAHILFHTDDFGGPSLGGDLGDALEVPAKAWGAEMNTGCFAMTAAAAPVAEAWAASLVSDDAFSNWKNDQQALNKILRAGAQLPPKGPTASRLVDVLDGTLRLGLLPARLFPSGHVFFIQRATRAGPMPIAVHATFQASTPRPRRVPARLRLAPRLRTATRRASATACARRRCGPSTRLSTTRHVAVCSRTRRTCRGSSARASSRSTGATCGRPTRRQIPPTAPTRHAPAP